MAGGDEIGTRVAEMVERIEHKVGAAGGGASGSPEGKAVPQQLEEKKFNDEEAAATNAKSTSMSPSKIAASINQKVCMMYDGMNV